MKQKHHACHRQTFLEQLSDQTAIIAAAPPVTMHRDVEWPYRQHSDFYYLTGLNEAQAVAIFAPWHKYPYTLFLQEKDLQAEIWDGERAGLRAAKKHYGADKAYPISELPQRLGDYLAGADGLYYHLGMDSELDRLVLAEHHKGHQLGQRSGDNTQSLHEPARILHEMRLHKSPTEIKALRKAAKISVKAHQAVLAALRPGMYEYQIQAILEQHFIAAGGSYAYPSIIASGDNACILHYTENRKKMRDGELLLIDAAAVYGYYNADITRTLAIGGRFSGRQRAIYEIVLAAQEAAIAIVKPKLVYSDIHQTALVIICSGLRDLGLLKGDIEGLLEQGAYRPYFMHGTGHWLGMDVHDVGNYRQYGQSRLLKPGHVFTVEPGIYIHRHAQAIKGQPRIKQKWRGIGVRIEDNILVTNKGYENLTAKAPKQLQDIER